MIFQGMNLKKNLSQQLSILRKERNHFALMCQLVNEILIYIDRLSNNIFDAGEVKHNNEVVKELFEKFSSKYIEI